MIPTTIRHQRIRRLASAYNVRLPRAAVCSGHASPIEFLDSWLYERPAMSLVLGPRGGGKSHLRGFATHVDCLQYDRHGAKILGGSEAQSRQVYGALKEFAEVRFAEADLTPELTATRARYSTGSEVEYIPASARSVRGPHVPSLCLDEVDEMDGDIRDAAFGMCMGMHGIRASAGMTSTWHRVGGPMAELIDRARGGDFPLYTFCVFDVLERCPEERSGPGLEDCPECPIQKWCHADRGEHPSGLPKAKRSSGHYPIESLVQKVKSVSARVFEADYLCSGPRADGVWFGGFSESTHVSEVAEYDPAYPVHLAVDSGVWTGAVWFQVREDGGGVPTVHVFADYLGAEESAEVNARRILEVGRQRCNGRIDRGSTDPAGKAKNAVGPAVLSIYAREGLKLPPWPVTGVADSLTLLESFISPADGHPRLFVHSRCRHLIDGLRTYRRKKRAGQWIDQPEDPQHPAEDLVDSLRGGLVDKWPAGRRPDLKLPRTPIGQAIG